MLPPATSAAEAVANGAQPGTDDAAPLDGELDTVLVEAAARPKTVPPPVPPASNRPGLISIRPTASGHPPISIRPVAPAEAIASALKPQYTGVAKAEHVDLQIDDLSLDLEHNPYTRSSLVPPPRKAPPVGAWLAGAAVGAVITSAAFMVFHPRLNGAAVVEPSLMPVAHVAAPVAPVAPVVPATPVAAAVVQTAPAAPAPVAAVEAPAVVAPPPVAPAVVEAKVAVPAQAEIAEASVGKAPPAAAQPSAAPAAVAEASAAAPSAAAAESESAAPAVAESPAPAEPSDTLSREQVVEGFEKLRADITTCANNGHGKVTAKVTIAGSGRVTYAVIEGDFAGTPEGSCMALVVRKATFPTFTAPSLKVSYPFGL